MNNKAERQAALLDYLASDAWKHQISDSVAIEGYLIGGEWMTWLRIDGELRDPWPQHDEPT